uniref:Uncharacterized protein n=1 Tax=Tanacetum cinerariifolium TaxID=118510 RepID=A0A6L2NF95_TANCI|nr:hypothetical protein [Tanacetum cinerariifolium]
MDDFYRHYEGLRWFRFIAGAYYRSWKCVLGGFSGREWKCIICAGFEIPLKTHFNYLLGIKCLPIIRCKGVNACRPFLGFKRDGLT